MSVLGVNRLLKIQRVVALGLCLTGVIWLGHHRFTASTDPENYEAAAAGNGGEFSWDELPSLKELKWTRCYGGNRECARLEVPLDYDQPDGRQASIALLRKPAGVPADSALYRGPILFNPGGPGGSGVGMALGWADRFSELLGPQFDIVGFDPRGVARSTPGVRVFNTSAQGALYWKEVSTATVTSDEVLARQWAQGRVFGQLARETDDGYLRHINTENTARDMLTIVQAHGQEKLQYWGLSYGTLLGSVFAAMFPDKVGRLVIDGVIDVDDWFKGQFLSGFEDTDKVEESFYTGCASAGPDNCPFWAPTPGDIRKNLTTIMESLRTKPLPVRTAKGYGLVDYAMLRMIVFAGLHSPYAAFRLLAQGLADIAAGNANTIFDMHDAIAFECKCGEKDVLSGKFKDANPAVYCNDGPAENHLEELEPAKKYFKELSEVTSWADVLVGGRFLCASWPKFDKRPFHGPFNVTTSHPILLIGNTADPVTPLRAAKKVSALFKHSVILTQDSVGHGSLSAPSICTQKYIRKYFLEGSLPDQGTVCRLESLPFPDPNSALHSDGTQASLSDEDWEIFSAVSSMSADMHGPVSRLAL